MVRTTRFKAEEISDLTGKVAIVTGTSPGGIGAETARQLAIHGAKVYLAARNEEKNLKTLNEIKQSAPEGKTLQLETLKLDLADLAAVRKSADEFKTREQKLDILILNAGVMACPKAITKDGWEVQFQTNYLGHFLFAKELLPLLEAASRGPEDPSRVITLTSIGHLFASASPYKINFDSQDAVNRTMGPSVAGNFFRYSQAKLAALLHAREWNSRIGRPGGSKVMASGVHPGAVSTNLYEYTPLGSLMKRVMITPADGALSSLYVATSPDLIKEDSWDVYRGDFGLKHHDSGLSRSKHLQTSLWELSEDAIKSFTSAPRTPAGASS
ncbi:hypothetical protein OC846_002121 [Tilletia horrida]|uniref:NAD(P)-binding protein n=1 Tax=Tilletia horrida TaxID=155126 RepID=A0AAN6GXM1_9BASI|nr:hypothetical protein OC846_002121 [Tilletia horrida]